jgi:hypothetical protein
MEFLDREEPGNGFEDGGTAIYQSSKRKTGEQQRADSAKEIVLLGACQPRPGARCGRAAAGYAAAASQMQTHA